MTCQEFESILYLYLDGEFQPEERLAAETHLAGCPECAQRAHEEGRLRQSLRRAARHSVEGSRAPTALRARLQANLHQEQRRESQSAWLRRGAAALVLVTVGGGSWMALRPEHHHRYVEDAVRRHTKKLPVEVVGVSHENVEAWFDGKLDHRVSVPRLQDVRLSGARISNVTDRPAAYISYEHHVEGTSAPVRRIGLFVFDDARRDVEAPPLAAVQVNSSLGHNVALWRDGEVVYELVSDLDEADIRRMLTEQSSAKGLTGKPSLPVLPVALQP